MRCAPAMSAVRPSPMIDVKKWDLPAGRLLIGLSGGADSVALMFLLLEADAQVAAVHVNHGLRGADSDGDEAFVRRLCEENQTPLWCYRAVPPENPGENWARQVRYDFFRQAMAESGAEALVLAHHRDDQAETLLLHLLRGSGLQGLTGMAADTVMNGMRILRPLLAYSRAELRAYLRERGQTWREDASNADPRYLRNALRADVLPRMEQLAPGATQRMAMTASLLAEDEAALNTLVQGFLAAHPGDALPVPALRAQPVGLQRRILRAWWNAAAPGQESLTAAQTESLRALTEAPASVRCNLPGGWHGQSGWTHLHLLPPGETPSLPTCPALESPLLAVAPFTGSCGDGRNCQAVPRQLLAECTVRSRRRGDYIRPFGTAGKQSLQDYLVNRHVDAAFRDRLPLLTLGSEVLLAGGVGAGAIPRTEEICDPVLLRWTARFPWQRPDDEDAIE